MNSKKKINIIHIGENFSPNTGGGVATVMKILTSELNSDSIKHEIVCNSALDVPKSIDTKITIFNKSDHLGWGYSRELIDFLSKRSQESNTIFHIHGIWKAIQYFAIKSALKNKTPCLITLHGMMEPTLSNAQGFLKRIKKDLYWKMFSRTFEKLKNVHAITNIEASNLKKRFKNSDITVIPNSMRIDDNFRELSIKNDERYFLFIGRIVAAKGIDILVKSFISSNLNSNYKLKIIGPIEDVGLWKNIKKLIDEHESIEYLGFKSGKEKDDLIINAWSLVLPSRMEAIGMVNLEAANMNCPSITTHDTGLHDWEEGGGILIESDSIDVCRQALIQSSSWTFEERLHRGKLSYNLAFKKYNISVINQTWQNLYFNLVNS